MGNMMVGKITLSDHHVSPLLAEVEYGSVYRAGKVPCLSVRGE